jgi:hypothetical protein
LIDRKICDGLKAAVLLPLQAAAMGLRKMLALGLGRTHLGGTTDDECIHKGDLGAQLLVGHVIGAVNIG